MQSDKVPAMGWCQLSILGRLSLLAFGCRASAFSKGGADNTLLEGNLRLEADTLNLFLTYKVGWYNANIPLLLAVIPVTSLEINP